MMIDYIFTLNLIGEGKKLLTSNLVYSKTILSGTPVPKFVPEEGIYTK